MGTLKLQARNGAVANISPDDNTASEAKITLPKKSGSIATIEDIQEALADGDNLDDVVEQVEENKQQIETNRQDIVKLEEAVKNLEESINALHPSYDSGEWEYRPPSTPNNFTERGCYFVLDGNGESTTNFANTAEIRFDNTDVTETAHTWTDVKAGQLIELFDLNETDFLLAEIVEVDVEDYYNWATFRVTVKQSVGGPSGRARMKITDNT
jgi:hypothetical protein